MNVETENYTANYVANKEIENNIGDTDFDSNNIWEKPYYIQNQENIDILDKYFQWLLKYKC